MIITAVEDLDIASAGSFVETALNAVPNEALAAVVDLTAARYVDSAGIRALFTIAEALRRRQQVLQVVVPPDAPLRRLLDIVQLETAARLFDRLDAAVSAVEVVPTTD